jgi:hypothetical protein
MSSKRTIATFSILIIAASATALAQNDGGGGDTGGCELSARRRRVPVARERVRIPGGDW